MRKIELLNQLMRQILKEISNVYIAKIYQLSQLDNVKNVKDYIVGINALKK